MQAAVSKCESHTEVISKHVDDVSFQMLENQTVIYIGK